MKKAYLLGVLILSLSPGLAVAYDHDRDDDKWRKWDDDHHSVTAKELAGIGFAGAALVGIAGYAFLRKRNLSA